VSEGRSYEALARDLERLDAILEQWEPEQRAAATARGATIEALNREALRRLIAHFKGDPAGLQLLKSSLDDPWIRGVLTYHGLVKPPKPPVEERLALALDRVRPGLASHGGDVELVAFVPPDEVKIRLLGACDGCSSAGTTLKLGVEEAIREACPEILKITAVAPRENNGLVTLRRQDKSPFSEGWEDAGARASVSPGALVAVELKRASVLLAEVGDDVKAYANACPHLGMPLDRGDRAGDVLTCRYHQFSFHLAEGNCLTAPEVALVSFPVRVHDGRILVQVGHG
jgi:nitrite reductase/ring-hydroxylating ferredoxin subunit/Fe-S cluster biogenesis protein NfuA